MTEKTAIEQAYSLLEPAERLDQLQRDLATSRQMFDTALAQKDNVNRWTEILEERSSRYEKALERILAATERDGALAGIAVLAKRALRLGTVLLAATLAGCCAPSNPYMLADQATYDAVAPEYLRYVEADTQLDDDQKARRRATVETWARRMAAAKENK